MIQIKNLKLPNNIFLSPMAGATDQAFRSICHELGAGLVVSEMISDKGLTYHNAKTLEMIKIADNEHPIALQIFGSDPINMKDAASLILEYSNPDMIDINMGCPMKKIVSNNSGSALLKDPKLIYDIVFNLTSNFDIPISAKIRTGWDMQSKNYLDVSKAIEDAGASMLTVHGRTRSQFYEGKANLDDIKKIKEHVKIPVIGNGDIIDIESAKHMFEYTGVDGIAIGRGSLGNPWIFRELTEYFDKGIIVNKPSKEEILMMILEHARRLITLKNEKSAIIEMRTHGPWYLKQLTNTKEYRVKFVSCKKYSEIESIINKCLQDKNVDIK